MKYGTLTFRKMNGNMLSNSSKITTHLLQLCQFSLIAGSILNYIEQHWLNIYTVLKPLAVIVVVE
jgi:hypothetical protein|tara:strand:+ start:67 stop:261 length:195 start_codon:yes stop_codon:yes gene_type:complete